MTAPGSSGVLPSRALFVAVAWSPGANPLVYFTSIAAALVRAATLAPTAASPITLVIYPGTYADPLVLVSNVHLSAVGGRRAVLVTGAVTWTAGAGINLAQAAAREEINTELISFMAPLAIDATAKTGNLGVFDGRDSQFRAGVTYLGRPALGPSDYFQVWDAILLDALASFDNVNLNVFSSSTGALALSGNTAIDIRACEIFGATVIGGTSAGTIEGTQINGTVAIGAGCAVGFTGSRFQPGSVLTVAAGGSADVRTAEYVTAANLAGLGTIDRSIWRTALLAAALGPNVIPIAPPLPDGNYGVSVTQFAGAPQFPPLVIAKLGASFTLVAGAAGADFDLVITKE
jgi:hypothetical protein